MTLTQLSGRGRTRSRASDTGHWVALPRINVYSASLVLLELRGSVFGVNYLLVFSQQLYEVNLFFPDLLTGSQNSKRLVSGSTVSSDPGS